MSRLLITGGAGFIGSHTCLSLLEAGYSLVVLDNLTNSHAEALRRVAELAGLEAWLEWKPGCWCTGSLPSRLSLISGDVRSAEDLARVFQGKDLHPFGAEPEPIAAVLHFAGLKAVGESLVDPLRYWDVNLVGSVRLLAAMAEANCRTLVFSSSATLYGFPDVVPIPETAAVQPINPYGRTKAAVEQMLVDAAAAPGGWRIACLRYFNPVGAHPSGRIGEDPRGVPSNIFPLIAQVAMGRRPLLKVFGGDWPTPDGTGVRDYIHVMDLAEGHRAALDVLLNEPPQIFTVNLGSGLGHSVLELVRAFEAISGRPVPIELTARRDGDAAISVADASMALTRLRWQTRRSLQDICRDGWAWQAANPEGYGTEQNGRR